MAAEKGVENLYRDKISKESEDRFRCELCHKMFKAVRFVQKHIDTKHVDIVNAIKDKALDSQFYTNYITDPGRILPSMQYKSKKEHRAAKIGTSHDKLRGEDKSGRQQGYTWSPRTTDLQSSHGDRRSPRWRFSRSPRNKSPRGRSSRSPRDRSPRSPRDRSPRSPRDRSPRSPRSPRDRPSRSPRTRSPLGRSPRRSPRGRSPLRYRSPRGRSSRSRSPYGGRSPWTRSPRNKSPWGPRSPLVKSSRRSPRRGSWDRSPRDRSPRDRSPRDRSLSWMGQRDRPPRDRSPWGRSPRDRSRERSPLDRSPRDRSRERRPSGRGSWSRRYSSGVRPRIEYVGRHAIPNIEFKDKLDPRSPILYVDLDRPPEDTFEIDSYEKALADFAAGAK